jgi:hypothetical protein
LHAAALRKPRAVSQDEDSQISSDRVDNESTKSSKKKGMILPFEPLIMTFHNVNYYVDMPKVNEFCFNINTRK